MSNVMKYPKVIVICGQTATGKSDFAVDLAKKINPPAGGEIISADSRQVYKGLNIGSGKITKKEMEGIPHHLLDIANPKTVFSVSQFIKKGEQAIKDILKRNRVPIICGGTGFYIDALVSGKTFPEVKPNIALRKKLNKENLESLQKILKDLDSERFKKIDIHNKVRLIRAIEIAKTLGKVPRIKKQKKYNVEYIGISFPDEILKQRIHDRLYKRMKIGMVTEVKKLHETGLSWKRLESFGLEYKYIALYLQKKLSKKEMLLELEHAIWHYAKRQKTWFKKNKNIQWINKQ